MINWIFVDKILIEVGIPIKLKGVIMEAITNFKMSVVWNGEKSISTPGKGWGNEIPSLLIHFYAWTNCLT